MSIASITQSAPKIERTRSHHQVDGGRVAAGRRRGLRAESPAVYRRRRAVAFAVAIAALTMVAMVGAGVLAGPGGVTASASGAGPAGGAVDPQLVGPATVVVLPGDTLWSIAERHRGEITHSRYLDALISYNGGASIKAGQVLILP
jgi:nucleoid-associated protein YgaU